MCGLDHLCVSTSRSDESSWNFRIDSDIWRFRDAQDLADLARMRQEWIVASEVPLRVIYTEQAAVALCTEVILPAADKAMTDAIADWSLAALLAVARCLNDAYADRVRRVTRAVAGSDRAVGPALAGKRSERPGSRDDHPPTGPAAGTLLARAVTGDINPDAFEISEAADLANEAIDASLSSMPPVTASATCKSSSASTGSTPSPTRPRSTPRPPRLTSAPTCRPTGPTGSGWIPGR